MQLPIEWLPATGAPQQLILLLHGWGSDGGAMAPLAQALRAAFPQAAVLAPDGPQATPAGSPGRQWYGIRRRDQEAWQRRVAGAVPPLQDWVRAQQRRLGVASAATAIGGFSQGAILSLALALHDDGIAGRVLAFGGCFATPPAAAPRHTTVHLFHGGADTVVPADASRRALQWMAELNGDATLDIAEGIGHEIHPVLIDRCLHRLTHHIPLRTWQAALGAVPAPNQALGAPPAPNQGPGALPASNPGPGVMPAGGTHDD